MIISKPIIHDIRPFDATEDKTIRWRYGGVYNKFYVTIYNIDNDTLVVSSLQTNNSNHEWTIPSDTLVNGVRYSVTITVMDDNDNEATSDAVVFKCLSEPSIDISIDGTITSFEYSISGSYYQSEGEPLKWAKVYVYKFDSSTEGYILFKELKKKYYGINDAYIPIDIFGWEDDSTYYIKIVYETVNGWIGVYQSEEFQTELDLSKDYSEIFKVVVTNNVEKGYTDVSLGYTDGFEQAIEQGTVSVSDTYESMVNNDVLKGFMVVRRPIDSSEWTIIDEIPITDENDWLVSTRDVTAQANTLFVYGIVPFDDECWTYTFPITTTIKTCYDGVFLFEANNLIYQSFDLSLNILSTISRPPLDERFNSVKLYNSVFFDDTTTTKGMSIYPSINNNYPYLVTNGVQKYEQGGVSALILGDSFYNTRRIDRGDVVKTNKRIKEFLTNGRAKILKDWNGNAWLIMVASSPTTSYDNNITMATNTIKFQWVEIGSITDNKVLSKYGFINVDEYTSSYFD